MITGFSLRKLQITSDSSPSAEVTFLPGFNVVTGPSDTGKSYLYQCIDYMLGGSSEPKHIDEGAGYSTIYLELVTYIGTIYTLQRGIRGGDYICYQCGIDELGNLAASSSAFKLKSEFDANDSNNISTFLLSLSGINGNIKIQKNARFETANLTFRTIYHLYLVDESGIIQEESPVHGKTDFNDTLSKWAFHYLLTGEDGNSLIAKPDPKIVKVQKLAKEFVFDGLIANLENEIQQLRTRSEGIDGIDVLERKISEQTNTISASSGVISEYQKERQSVWNSQQHDDSRIIAIDELLLRFSLLKKHYKSDEKRLEFMSEGDFYFQQLETVNCPLCGTPLVSHDARQGCIEKDGLLIDIQAASREEIQKIAVQLKDLENTFRVLEEERLSLLQKSAEKKARIEELDHIITDSLSPRLIIEKAELDRLLAERRIVDELEINTKMLQDLWISRANVVPSVPQLPRYKSQERKASLDGSAIRKLCDEIEQLLNGWKYPEKGTVEFSEQTMDISIEGKQRRNHGKGVRALLRSAFNIGFMRYCIEYNRPHPRIVVLDSPLLNYRERSASDAEEISAEVKQSFFTNLADLSNIQQIIVFENEPVPNDLKESINLIEFVGRFGVGRSGFFPLQNS